MVLNGGNTMWKLYISLGLLSGIALEAMEIDQTTHQTTPASLIDLCAEKIAGLTLDLEYADYHQTVLQNIPEELCKPINNYRHLMLKGHCKAHEWLSKKIFKNKYLQEVNFLDIKDTLSPSNTYAETNDKTFKVKLEQNTTNVNPLLILESCKSTKIFPGANIQSIGLTENPLLIWTIERKNKAVKDYTKINDEEVPYYPDYKIYCYNDNGSYLRTFTPPVLEKHILKADITENAIVWFIEHTGTVFQYQCDLTKFKQFIMQIQNIAPRELCNIGSTSDKTYMNKLLKKLGKKSVKAKTTIPNKLQHTKKQKR
jgi:hypothetical protein